MDSEHARQLIPDYILGLLSADDSRRVEQHAQQCATCREAIRRERQLGALLRQTVQAAARPPAGRLEQLRPAHSATAARRPARLPRPLNRQLAPLTALAVLLVVVLLAQAGGFGPALPALARPATATMTHTPTATLAAAGDDADTPAAATSAPATLTRMALSGEPPVPEPPPAANQPGSPTVAATPIITYAR